jgi:choline dehydrogenase-like flavoprotein
VEIVRKPETYDAVIIGSGAGGGMAAMVLTQGGLRCALLEAGPSIDPAVDYKEHACAPYLKGGERPGSSSGETALLCSPSTILLLWKAVSEASTTRSIEKRTNIVLLKPEVAEAFPIQGAVTKHCAAFFSRRAQYGGLAVCLIMNYSRPRAHKRSRRRG